MKSKSAPLIFSLVFASLLFAFNVRALNLVNLDEKLDGYREKTEDYLIEAKVLAENLNHPWAVTWLNNNLLLVSERRGKLLLFEIDQQGKAKKTEIKNFPSVHSYGQGGLLDLKTHPNYLINGWIYATYAASNPKNTIESATTLARFRLVNDQISNLEVLFQARPYKEGNRHFGSRIAFDSMTRVYITVGDRGERVNSQDLQNHIGKIIRLNSDGSAPENNPFLDGNSPSGETGILNQSRFIFSYGHRNPQGLVIYNNKIYSHEHGPKGGDEFNAVEEGKNYGWPKISYGKEYLSGLPVGTTVKAGMEQPLLYWSPSIAPSGLVVYDGRLFPKWQGDFFLGSLVFGQIHRLRLNEKNQVIKEEKLLDGRFGRIRDITVGGDGLIYFITDADNGSLVQIRPLKTD